MWQCDLSAWSSSWKTEVDCYKHKKDFKSRSQLLSHCCDRSGLDITPEVIEFVKNLIVGDDDFRLL